MLLIKKDNLKLQKRKTIICFSKNNFLQAEGMNIAIFNKNADDYFCLTNMVENKYQISYWLRTVKTIKFLAAWESIHNKNFKVVESDNFKLKAQPNVFKISPQKWIKATNAIGIICK